MSALIFSFSYGNTGIKAVGFSYRLRTGYEDNTDMRLWVRHGAAERVWRGELGLNFLVEKQDVFYWPETPRASSQVFILYVVSHGIPEWFCRGHVWAALGVIMARMSSCLPTNWWVCDEWDLHKCTLQSPELRAREARAPWVAAAWVGSLYGQRTGNHLSVSCLSSQRTCQLCWLVDGGG